MERTDVRYEYPFIAIRAMGFQGIWVALCTKGSDTARGSVLG